MGAINELQERQMVEELTQVEQIGAQGSQLILVIFGNETFAGQVVRHWNWKKKSDEFEQLKQTVGDEQLAQGYTHEEQIDVYFVKFVELFL